MCSIAPQLTEQWWGLAGRANFSLGKYKTDGPFFFFLLLSQQKLEESKPLSQRLQAETSTFCLVSLNLPPPGLRVSARPQSCLTTWKRPQRNAAAQHLLQASPTQRNCPPAPLHQLPPKKHLARRDSRGSSEESAQSPETSGGGRELDPSKGTGGQRGQCSVFRVQERNAKHCGFE